MYKYTRITLNIMFHSLFVLQVATRQPSESHIPVQDEFTFLHVLHLKFSDIIQLL